MPGPTLVDVLNARDVWTVAVGKTSDLVNTTYNEKIKLTRPSFLDPALRLRFMHEKKKDTNPYNIQGTVNALAAAAEVYRPAGTFVFSNLVDGDSLYGHTRDVPGGLRGLEGVDLALPLFEERMRKGDLLVITADHGMQHRADYGYHNKEELPLIVERMGCGADLGGIKAGPGNSLCEVGDIVAQALGCAKEYESACG